MTDLTERLQRYVRVRREMPLTQLGDSIHCIHTGTEHEAELRLSDLTAGVSLLETLTQENARLREAGWRDIESAPRDGRDALVGCWVINYDEPEKPPVWSAWETVFDGGPLGCDGTWGDEPTHWHDMPAPPPLPARKALGGGDE